MGEREKRGGREKTEGERERERARGRERCSLLCVCFHRPALPWAAERRLATAELSSCARKSVFCSSLHKPGEGAASESTRENAHGKRTRTSRRDIAGASLSRRSITPRPLNLSRPSHALLMRYGSHLEAASHVVAARAPLRMMADRCLRAPADSQGEQQERSDGAGLAANADASHLCLFI